VVAGPRARIRNGCGFYLEPAQINNLAEGSVWQRENVCGSWLQPRHKRRRMSAALAAVFLFLQFSHRLRSLTESGASTTFTLNNSNKAWSPPGHQKEKQVEKQNERDRIALVSASSARVHSEPRAGRYGDRDARHGCCDAKSSPFACALGRPGRPHVLPAQLGARLRGFFCRTAS
jgi:hypothetical protein